MSRFVLALAVLTPLCFPGCVTLRPPAISDIREDVVKVEYEVPHRAFHVPDSKTLARVEAAIQTGSVNTTVPGIVTALEAELLANAKAIAQAGCERYGDRVAEEVSTRCVRFKQSGGLLFGEQVCTHKEALFTCAPR